MLITPQLIIALSEHLFTILLDVKEHPMMHGWLYWMSSGFLDILDNTFPH